VQDQMMNDNKLKVYQIIVDKLGVKQTDLADNVSFYDDLAVDSLDFCELIVDIEKAFNILIEDDQYDKLKTVGALVNFVEQKVSANSPAMAYAH
jgi:acyl carrier protein